jgi:hypothetical protein
MMGPSSLDPDPGWYGVPLTAASTRLLAGDDPRREEAVPALADAGRTSSSSGRRVAAWEMVGGADRPIGFGGAFSLGYGSVLASGAK